MLPLRVAVQPIGHSTRVSTPLTDAALQTFFRAISLFRETLPQNASSIDPLSLYCRDSEMEHCQRLSDSGEWGRFPLGNPGLATNNAKPDAVQAANPW